MKEEWSEWKGRVEKGSVWNEGVERRKGERREWDGVKE